MKSTYTSLNRARHRALTSAVISFAVMGILAGLYLQDFLVHTRGILWLGLVGSAACLMIFSEQARQAQRALPRIRRLHADSNNDFDDAA